MNHPTFTASITAAINQHTVTLIQPTPEQLTALLDLIGKSKVYFNPVLKVQATSSTALMYILSIIHHTNNRYYATADLYKGRDMIELSDLPPTAISAIMQRLWKDYRNNINK